MSRLEEEAHLSPNQGGGSRETAGLVQPGPETPASIKERTLLWINTSQMKGTNSSCNMVPCLNFLPLFVFVSPVLCQLIFYLHDGFKPTSSRTGPCLTRTNGRSDEGRRVEQGLEVAAVHQRWDLRRRLTVMLFNTIVQPVGQRSVHIMVKH